MAIALPAPHRVIPACLLVVLLLLQACASLPQSYERDGSSAILDYEETALHALFREREEVLDGHSGFTILPKGRDAFVARIAMAQMAEKSLDLQYYIWEPDRSGRILADALIAAAERGVRVRVLLDDINLRGQDAVIAAIDRHPNIQIRLFNPFANRSFRTLDLLVDLGRVNHRMHNKAMIADNALAVMGGRNIGDHYFDVAQDANFRDMDIAAVGPVVRDASDIFDYFWNGEWSIPIAALADAPLLAKLEGGESFQEVRDALAEGIDLASYPHPVYEEAAYLERELKELRANFVWAPAHVVWDDPESIVEGRKQGEILIALDRRLKTLESELLAEVAYFVPGDYGMEALEELQQRGVRVRLLTNSLSSNDVLAAHAGYAIYRKRLLESGVELYEVRADSAEVQQTLLSGRSRAALHTKAAVFDGEAIFIGSFNFDPRSAVLNTKIGLYVESPELARRLTAFMDEGVRPETSYRVEQESGDALTWVAGSGPAERRYDHDPATSFSQRFLSDMLGLLPIESQL